MDRKISDKKYREKNKKILTEKRKEFADNNKDRISEYNKKYYEENKEAMFSKIECECGSMICMKHKARHFKSNIHKAFEKGKGTMTPPSQI